ncbi:hypothetical protein ABMA27_009228 [Loxostege sticticalis]|uniref:Gustatory receptor n=1 Tax=Loxostege sticticalis TaxID=481309 RepID=A0ABR3HAD2_LOXSC
MIDRSVHEIEEDNQREVNSIVNLKNPSLNFLDKDFQTILRPLDLIQQLWFSTKCDVKDNFISPKSVSSVIITSFGHVAIFYYMSLIFDFNIVVASNIIHLLQKQLFLWISEVNNFTSTSIEDLIFDERRVEILESFFDMISAFNLFKQTHQVMMLYHVTEIFVHTLLYVQHFLEFGKYNQGNIIKSPLMFILLWLLKSVFIHSGLCLECELFYIAVRDSEEACWKILQSEKCTDQERRICKNILRCRRTELDSFRACGMYLAGAQLPLCLVTEVFSFRNFSSVKYFTIITVQLISYSAIPKKSFNYSCKYELISLLKSQLLSWTTEIQNFAVRADEDFTLYGRREEILKSFFDIISAFNLFKKAFQVMMKLAVMYMIIWQMKTVFIHSGLCLECELFYIAVRDSEIACFKLLHSGKFTEQERRICKNILRTRRTELDSFRACGMYLAGAQLPMRLVSLIANSTIVLLQFAFVK